MGNPFYNPFFGPPPPADQERAAALEALQHPGLALKRPSNPFHGQGPLLSLADQAQLEQAPKLPAVHVQAEAYPAVFPGDPLQHMYLQFGNGADDYILRGGPTNDLTIGATVTPADQSRDYRRGQRVLWDAYVPDTTTDQLAAAARAYADRVNKAGDPYLVGTSNSNSVIGDFTAQQFGHRVGDARTPGYRYDLPDKSPIPDLSPWIAEPFWR